MLPPTLDIFKKLHSLHSRRLARTRPVFRDLGASKIDIDGKELLSFASDDVLGLGNDPDVAAAVAEAIAGHGVTSHSSSTLVGQSALGVELEIAAARFLSLERALLFPSGREAMLDLLETLTDAGDVLFVDSESQAILEGAGSLSWREVRVYPHSDPRALAGQMSKLEGRRAAIVTDGVFPLQGDIAPLAELLTVAEEHNAWLIVQDAYGFGILGHGGAGILSHLGLSSPRVVLVADLGRVVGTPGAFVAGQTDVIDWLIQSSRAYATGSAVGPLINATFLASLRRIHDANDARERLRSLISRFKEDIPRLPWDLTPSGTHIFSFRMETRRAAQIISRKLIELGIFAPAVSPPADHRSGSRLRLALSAAHTDEDIDYLKVGLDRVAWQIGNSPDGR